MSSNLSNAHLDLSPQARWSMIRVGLWIRVAFAGASAALTALILLFSGDAAPLYGLAAAAAGGLVAALSWRRAWRMVGASDLRVGAASSEPTVTSPAGPEDARWQSPRPALGARAAVADA